VGEEFFALDNFCLHRGGPLGEGEADGYSLTCPWHGWTYDLRSGAFEIIPALKVKTYNTKVEGDSVLVDPEPRPAYPTKPSPNPKKSS
jgi:nitrite reductase/ring-hydroxylating ferredoxin subunit